MGKRKLILWSAIILLIIALTVFSLYNRYSQKAFNPKKFLNEVKEENKPGLDSLQDAINYENYLNYRIQEAINDSDFRTAYTLMDSLPAFGKVHSIYLFKGMILEKQKKYPDAIKEYNEALNEIPYSKARSMRAELYIKMNEFQLALYDYMEIYKYNHYFSCYIANTFLLLNKRDSALKYYQIYLEHYPNDTAVQQKLSRLRPANK